MIVNIDAKTGINFNRDLRCPGSLKHDTDAGVFVRASCLNQASIKN